MTDINAAAEAAAAQAATLALAGTISGVVATLIAGGALALSIVNYLQARETSVTWRIERVVPAPHDSRMRLVNGSQRLTGTLVSLSDPDRDDETDRVDPDGLALPAVIPPGNSVQFVAIQYLNDIATRVRIEWTQPRRLRWRGPKTFSTTLYR